MAMEASPSEPQIRAAREVRNTFVKISAAVSRFSVRKSVERVTKGTYIVWECSGSAEVLQDVQNANHCFKTLSFEAVIGYTALFLNQITLKNLEKKRVFFVFFLKNLTGNPISPS